MSTLWQTFLSFRFLSSHTTSKKCQSISSSNNNKNTNNTNNNNTNNNNNSDHHHLNKCTRLIDNNHIGSSPSSNHSKVRRSSSSVASSIHSHHHSSNHHHSKLSSSSSPAILPVATTDAIVTPNNSCRPIDCIINPQSTIGLTTPVISNNHHPQNGRYPNILTSSSSSSSASSLSTSAATNTSNKIANSIAATLDKSLPPANGQSPSSIYNHHHSSSPFTMLTSGVRSPLCPKSVIDFLPIVTNPSTLKQFTANDMWSSNANSSSTSSSPVTDGRFSVTPVTITAAGHNLTPSIGSMSGSIDIPHSTPLSLAYSAWSHNQNGVDLSKYRNMSPTSILADSISVSNQHFKTMFRSPLQMNNSEKSK